MMFCWRYFICGVNVIPTQNAQAQRLNFIQIHSQFKSNARRIYTEYSYENVTFNGLKWIAGWKIIYHWPFENWAWHSSPPPFGHPICLCVSIVPFGVFRMENGKWYGGAVRWECSVLCDSWIHDSCESKFKRRPSILFHSPTTKMGCQRHQRRRRRCTFFSSALNTNYE